MDIHYLNSNGIFIDGNSISIKNKSATVQISGSNMFIVFSSGELIKLDKAYNVKIPEVSGKNSVGVILD